MTLLFHVKIGDEIHHVRVEVPPDRPETGDEQLEEFVITTAFLEHYGRLPRGVPNALD
jgi:hypothetical protein